MQDEVTAMAPPNLEVNGSLSNAALQPTWMRGPPPPVHDCKIIVECEDFAVIEKPPHVLVHPTKPTGEPTLLSWLCESRPGIAWSLVQRLDRETSGLLLAAKSARAASRLGKMLMNKEIGKEYLALTSGQIPWVHCSVEAPIVRLGISAENPIYLKRGVREEGAPSCTHFERLAQTEKFSLVCARPQTGRLHQIRVHLAHIGYPLIGDKIYGPDSQLYLRFIESGWSEEMRTVLRLRRHALHASRLKFTWDGLPWDIASPLPNDLREFSLSGI